MPNRDFEDYLDRAQIQLDAAAETAPTRRMQSRVESLQRELDGMQAELEVDAE